MPRIVSLERSWTLCSRPPHPGVDIFAATLTFPRSASVAFTLATAAHPPSSLKSERRNSFAQTTAHLFRPSSELLNALESLSGFLIPIITVTTFARFGLPFTDILATPSYSEYSWESGCKDGLLIFKFCNFCSSISMLFSRGQIKSSSPVYQGVTESGISYS